MFLAPTILLFLYIIATLYLPIIFHYIAIIAVNEVLLVYTTFISPFLEKSALMILLLVIINLNFAARDLSYI